MGLIERLGPRSNYLTESHTLKHFRTLWSPGVFDSSFTKEAAAKGCQELLKERTIDISESHQRGSIVSV